ncbi:MAG TPA: bifunctional DNA-formamidopyrimidine glycosylase/DNA-(apurinic or apyrimidinic site) lyase [Acidiferrobacter sp.]|nr:bifunctional DNA-formamidopyrimidine glycosylase/DNA-(apurinic or apyrimidinic site) lyase [Acidiferrobacter sp.]
MPELPEVETTLRGLAPLLCGARITGLIVRDARLRWPIAPGLSRIVSGQTIRKLTRRSKYLLFDLGAGSLIIHLGMSGSLQVTSAGRPPGPWDPFDIVFADGQCLRMRDPRRFGALLYSEDPRHHPLIRQLGPEPLAAEFSGAYLHDRARGRKVAIRDFLLNGRIVAGIGNIYAHEALFEAGIRPLRAAGRISLARYEALATAIIDVLNRAIAAGGTTLQDFVGSDGRPGYFQQQLRVYGREGASCLRCRGTIARLSHSARSSYYCPKCQH